MMPNPFTKRVVREITGEVNHNTAECTHAKRNGKAIVKNAVIVPGVSGMLNNYYYFGKLKSIYKS